MGSDQPLNRFAVLVPAHNEELLIGILCQSLLDVDYPRDKYVVHIIADNCSDSTADIAASLCAKVLERTDPADVGKGQALSWALQRIDLDQFDAVLIVDADNYVGNNILTELNRMINSGEQSIQCYNAVGNRADSWFTQLLYVSRTIGNLLYHEAKYRLGLSSYLMGNGLCFRAELLKKKGWTAFSVGEDWEYYAQLVESGVMVAFAAKAKVFHQESKSLNQATSQRLRWSSGRFYVAWTQGLPLLFKGLRKKNWHVVDASLPLLTPNYSLLINLTLVGFFISLLLPTTNLKLFLLIAFFLLIMAQFTLFVTGAFIAGSPIKTSKAVLYVPFFLVWKAVIDILCITGLYRGKKWVRTKRH
ncbi:glycosyl transferase [Desulfosarcina alkanivorans]|uniref:Glycosyl transferase n=2 Tax=Desulfosarcina alkanivorans TaxID=571177 RepID=A0A5K7YFC0_9BACT|nr:glycosyl transferase [Desulfosarcina alkanivorans]